MIRPIPTGGSEPGRARPGSSFSTVALLAVLLAGSGHAAPDADDAAQLVEILGDRQARAERPVAVRKRLVDLGPAATDAVFDLFAGRVTGLGPHASLDMESKALLYDVLRSWPSREVVARIDDRVDARSPLGERMLALQLLGEVGEASAIPVLADIVATFSPQDARPLQVRVTIETALRRILIRDRRAYGEMGALIDQLELHHLPPVVAALGEGGAAEGLRALERLLGKSDELDLAVLEALSKMDRWDPDADRDRCAWIVRGYLNSEDALFRRQAAISLGRLDASESVPDLIEALGDQDRRVRCGALWGLQEITGLRFEGDKERWLAWHFEQMEWFDTRSPELVELALDGEPGPAVAALREIGHYRLFADDLVGHVALALEHRSPEVAAYACGTLAQLGHPRAFPFLVEALDDYRNKVKTAAGRCLQVLTRMNLPPDSQVWREWAASGKSLSPHG